MTFRVTMCLRVKYPLTKTYWWEIQSDNCYFYAYYVSSLLEWNISSFFFPTVHEEVVSARGRSGVFLPPVFSVWCGCEKGGGQTAPLHRQYPVLVWGSIPLCLWEQFCTRQLLPAPHHPHPLWVVCDANPHWFDPYMSRLSRCFNLSIVVCEASCIWHFVARNFYIWDLKNRW